MKFYHKNPRQITRDQYGSLEQWLRELGDLGGIIHNIPTDEIISANQRCRIIDVNQCEIILDVEYDEPDEQGTVAWGYVLWEGHRYSYRAVVWDEKTCEQANIVANKAGGEWDWDILANEWDIDDLLEWGFDASELGIVEPEAYDFSELDQQLEDLAPLDDVAITLIVPQMHREAVEEWLANGEGLTAPGMGRGVMKRCGLL